MAVKDKQEALETLRQTYINKYVNDRHSQEEVVGYIDAITDVTSDENPKLLITLITTLYDREVKEYLSTIRFEDFHNPTWTDRDDLMKALSVIVEDLENKIL